MSVKRSVNTKIWADAWIESLSPVEKLVWLYLLTNSYTNMLGIYQISIKRIVFETGLTQQQIINALKAFERVKKAFFWFDEWMVLPNWIKNQSMNSNMLKSAIESFKVLPKNLIDRLKDNGFESFESLSKGYQTLPNIEYEYEIESEEEKEPESDCFSFELFWETYHEKTGKQKTDKEPALSKWKKLNDKERKKAIEMIDEYSKTNEPKYLKKARTYLNDKTFNDEMKPAEKQLSIEDQRTAEADYIKRISV